MKFNEVSLITIKELSKKFQIYRSQKDRLKEWATFGNRTYHEDSWVLKNINLQVNRGETLGIIGMNGAGKSTLLKIVTGTLAPTSGSVHLVGKVAALLELGTGFHLDLTGRENILLNGKILGLNSKQIAEKMEGIKEFSELGDYFDKPVRTYSTGMYVRLAFSLASSTDPDVLIIDEALSVGDAYFQQKCIRRIEEFKKKNVSILFVSHDLAAIKLLCDRVVFLDQGQVRSVGNPLETLELYNAFLSKINAPSERLSKPDPKHGLRSGNKKAIIEEVYITNKQEQKILAMEVGQQCTINLMIKFIDNIENPTVGIMIRDRLGYDIFGTNTAHSIGSTGTFKAGQTYKFCFKFSMDIGPGDYTLTVASHSEKTHVEDCYDWADRIVTFKVLAKSDFQFLGVSYLRPQVSINQIHQ